MTPSALRLPSHAYLMEHQAMTDIEDHAISVIANAVAGTPQRVAHQDFHAMANEPELSPLYVLRVTGEERATRQLAEAGITSWAPTFKKLRLAIGRQPTRLIERALIPGYVFARLGEDDFAAAMATERVHGVITSAGTPRIFPESEFTHVLMMAISGRFDDRLPSTKAKPRGVRRRGLAGLHAWFEAVEASQLQSARKSGTFTVGGEPVSEDIASSRRSTSVGRKAA